VLAAGTFIEPSPDPERVYNTSVIFGPDGGRLATYRKIHLFDVGDVGDGFAYTESASVAPGDRAVVVDTPAARLGASVCFDLRFPGLYQTLADGGAEILLVPSAFTRPTGAAHWSVLLRARAIETQCFVVAAAQTGDHTEKRKTWGHSMVIDPWGGVLLELGTAPEVATVTIDLDAIAAARAKVPTAANRRVFRR
jgi:predicted amidohydrolase